MCFLKQELSYSVRLSARWETESTTVKLLAHRLQEHEEAVQTDHSLGLNTTKDGLQMACRPCYIWKLLPLQGCD